MEIKAPGLRWVKRRTDYTPYWVASDPTFKPRTVNLGFLRDTPDQVIARCVSFQAEMKAWKTGFRRPVACFDGTMGSLIRKYQSDPESPYADLRPASRIPYNHYIRRLDYEVGARRIDTITGIDLKRWHRVWSHDGDCLAASKMMRAVLDAAVSHGICCRIPGCVELREVLKAAGRKLPAPKRRESVITADQVVDLRAAAHADGRPSSALAYALVFETTLRLWDVVGQWVPIEPSTSSTIRHRHAKEWFGLRWEDIDENLVLRYVPSKTSAKTGLSVTFPLSRAPMVMEELALYPTRQGPVVVCESNRLPYSSNRFGEFWRKDRAAAGVPSSMWARDLRASGITEGRAGGASTDDAAKVAGHASVRTTAEIYDRAVLEAAERMADARVQYRSSITPKP